MLMILSIIYEVLLPLFVLIGLGIILHRTFKFDMNTLSKLNLYYLVPSIIFVKVYESNLSMDLFMQIILFLSLLFAILFMLTQIIIRLLKMEKGLSASFSNSVLLTNNANFGLPVNELAYRHDPLSMTIQIMTLAFQNFLTYTFGLFNAGAAKKGLKKGLMEIFKMPIFYALILGVLMNILEVEIPEFLWIPLDNGANGFMAIALVTLGAQVATMQFKRNILSLALSSFTRLIVSPVIGLFLILALGIEGMTAKALLIASALPTSRNSALLALEYDNEPEFAAQAVIISTLCSSITIAFVIYLANILF